MRKFALIVTTAVLTMAGGATVQAHHAVQAQFDVSKNVVFTGVLKKVDWQNPHAWFHFEVKKPDGSTEIWSTETVGPNGLRRLGLSDRRLFVIGQTYEVDICPDRTGKNLGFTNSFKFPDGKVIKVGFPSEPGGEPPAAIN